MGPNINSHVHSHPATPDLALFVPQCQSYQLLSPDIILFALQCQSTSYSLQRDTSCTCHNPYRCHMSQPISVPHVTQCRSIHTISYLCLSSLLPPQSLIFRNLYKALISVACFIWYSSLRIIYQQTDLLLSAAFGSPSDISLSPCTLSCNVQRPKINFFNRRSSGHSIDTTWLQYGNIAIREVLDSVLVFRTSKLSSF